MAPERKERTSNRVLRFHKTTAILLVFYIPLVVIPWVATCMLDVKPMTTAGSSYVEPRGTYSEDVLKAVGRWTRAIRILNTLAAALAVPVISAILSHAAVVYVQRRRHGQQLSIPGLLALANAPWSRLGLGQIPQSPSVVIAGVGLVLLGIIQLVLQSAVMSPEALQVAASNDTPNVYPNRYPTYTLIGYDPEPALLAVAPSNAITQHMANKIAVEGDGDIQPYIWLDTYAWSGRVSIPSVYIPNNTLGLYYNDGYSADRFRPFFVSAFPPSIDTGVLRYHAMRLNSSINCSPLAREEYPSTCTGDRPFTSDSVIRTNGTDALQIRWCNPGAYDTTPWSLSRSRQDITEEVFLDVFVPWDGSFRKTLGLNGNFTVHCTASTTRGYFELPNYYNGFQAGPLIEKWPSQEVLETEFNDAIGRYMSDLRTPTESDAIPRSDYTTAASLGWTVGSDPFNTNSQITPGPFTASLLAMIGNGSWYQAVQNASINSDNLEVANAVYLDICSRGLPLTQLQESHGFWAATTVCNRLDYSIGRDYASTYLASITYEWFLGAFNNTNYTLANLGSAMYFANEALLTETAAAAAAVLAPSHRIYQSSGRTVVKPSVALPAKIVISILLFVEIAALLALALFIYRVPTFASYFDSVSVAVIGAQILASGVRLPDLSLAKEKSLSNLKDHDGLIGIRDEEPPTYEEANGSSNSGEAHADTGGARRSSSTRADDMSDPARAIEMVTLHGLGGTAVSHAPGSSAGCLAVGAPGLISRRR
ncbi:hypothetical protein F5B20DRAFT_526672 [Whalleya microplaca]|nr:hypothetical protein F5B20DRAFT_526672 [Whalleya microplaca]